VTVSLETHLEPTTPGHWVKASDRPKKRNHGFLTY